MLKRKVSWDGFRAPTTYVAICFGWKKLMCIIPIFWRFKDKSSTVVSSIIMKEDSYSEPAIRRVEMPCSPEHTKPLETQLFYRTTPIFCFYAQIICNHAPHLCTGHLQNCYHGFIFWVLKGTVSLRWYYICFSWKHLKRIYRFLFCVFKDKSFTVAPLDFWNSCKRLQNRKSPIYNHGFISWVLKRTVSLRRHFWVLTRYILVENI